ncbi:Ig domain-containing protein, partial [Myxococcota bacterium]
QVEITATKDGVLPPEIVSVPRHDAVVGAPYEYDEDKLPTVLGGGPYSWSAGKSVGGQTLGLPDGLNIDERTGEIFWTPSDDQLGEHALTLLVENVAGVGMQEYAITVEAFAGEALSGGGNPAGAGCACGEGAGSAKLGAVLLFAGFLRVASRRRFGARGR